MNLLSKFAAVKVDPTKTLLKGEDLEICNGLAKEFETAFGFYDLAIEFLDINKDANRYIEFHKMYDKIEKKIEEIAKEFIGDIVGHFTGKYKVTIDLGSIEKKLIPDLEYYIRERDKENKTIRSRIARFKITLDMIVPLIQDQLGGMSLDEKGENEIKEKFWRSFAQFWNRKPHVELSKNRITIDNAFYFTASWSGKGINYGRYSNSTEKVGEFYRALSLFEGDREINPAFANLAQPYTDFPTDELLKEHEFQLEKIKAIRFYKNGKTVIKFASNEIAEEFFRIYCREGKASVGDR